MTEKLIGTISHWFGNIKVAGIDLTSKLAVGDQVHILGHTTDFEQEIKSMQIMHQDVSEAGRGDDVGVKLKARARVGDKVYKVE
jgi:selenocysteine-specific translation elongation factor